MDPFKGQGGIQMLLIAEQEAQHIVSNARNCKIPFFYIFYNLVIKVLKMVSTIILTVMQKFFKCLQPQHNYNCGCICL